jgi:AcrR family transcriptional regulator
MADVPPTDTRQRLTLAAFELFAERGYEQTTVDDVALRAGLGRTTFFRHFRSKDDVVFPGHDRVIAKVALRLESAADGDAVAAVCDGARMVFRSYVDDPDVARQRYALTSSVPALRERELVSTAAYQRLFRDHLTRWTGPGEDGHLQAEVVAAAVVAAHNLVLRRWLRGELDDDPVGALDAALDYVRRTVVARAGSGAASSAVVVVAGVPDGGSMDDVVERVRRAVESG